MKVVTSPAQNLSLAVSRNNSSNRKENQVKKGRTQANSKSKPKQKTPDKNIRKIDAFVIKTPKTNGPNCSTCYYGQKHHDSDNANKEDSNKKTTPVRRKKGDQRTVTELKGVVGLESIQNAVKILQDKNVPANEKTSLLVKLSTKQPSTDIIKSSGIGKFVRKISKVSIPNMNEEERKLVTTAEKLYEMWKYTVQKRVEIECRATDIAIDYNAPTKKIRENAANLILRAANAKGGKHHDGNNHYNEKFKSIASKVEKFLFEKHNRLTNDKYRKSIRKLIFDIRHDKD